MDLEELEREQAWGLHQAMVLLSAVLIPVVGVAYQVTAPDEWDPMSHRVGFLLGGLALVGAERRWPALRRWGQHAAFALGVGFVAWFVGTAVWAGFPIGRVMGLFTLQFAGTVLFRRPAANLAWQVAAIGLTWVGLSEAVALQVSPGMLLAAMTTLATMSVTATAMGDRMLRALEDSRVALADAHDRLEERVRERTAALQREVEERRSAEQRAEAANLAKSRFLANMSHELRTPLNAIVGYSELLQESLPPGAELEDVGKVLVAATHLRAMIDDVLDLARIEAGRLSLVLGEVALREVVDEAAAAVAPQLARQGNTLRLELPDDLPRLRVDRGRLLQVLLNLLSNAARFTERGTIVVSARADEQVRIAVRDTGVGIAPEHLPRLFQKFSQVDESPTRRHGGTGLGLAISQELAALHGGRIEVTSAVGVGSTFTVVLPLPRAAPVVEAEGAAAARA
jgi:signal transduction histidine kinase